MLSVRDHTKHQEYMIPVYKYCFLLGERNSWYAEHYIKNSLITFQNKQRYKVVNVTSML